MSYIELIEWRDETWYKIHDTTSKSVGDG